MSENTVWYDKVVGNEHVYGMHVFHLEPNSTGIKIVKCIGCHKARMYLKLMGITNCVSQTKQKDS